MRGMTARRFSRGQQALGLQKRTGDLRHRPAVHIHGVGQLHHIFAAHLTGEELQHLFQVGRRVVEPRASLRIVKPARLFRPSVA